MKHHIHITMSDDDMMHLAEKFKYCEKELEIEIPNTHYLIHLRRDDADE
jgi:hypothetical protein